MYINHRPVHDHTEGDLLHAWGCAVLSEPGRVHDEEKRINLKDGDIIKRDGLVSLLQQYG